MLLNTACHGTTRLVDRNPVLRAGRGELGRGRRQFGFLRYAVFGELSSPVIGVESGYKKSFRLNRVGGFR